MASEAKPLVSISSPSQTRYLIIQILLKCLAIALSLSAFFVLITSKESASLFMTVFIARYNFAATYRFLAVAIVATCGLSVLSLIFVLILNRRGSNVKSYFFVFLIDMVTMLLIVSGCAAATAIGHVAELGEDKAGWVPICTYVGKFCHQVVVSVVLCYLTFFSYLALTILSAKKLMST